MSRRWRREDGSVLVLVAMWLPVLILFAGFVLDVGNWYTHRRHLQTQADAAALAGGDSFSFPCNGGNIETGARSYGGPSATTSTAWNPQVANVSRTKLHVVLNSSRFYNESPTPPESGFGDLGNPCTAGFLDVKITESNLPWLLRASKVVPAINAHARVTLKQETTRSGTIPVAVPDPGTVTKAAVDFINEDTGAVLGTSNLASAGGGAFNNSATPVTVNMAGPAPLPAVTHLGVVVKLSGANPPPSTLTCGQSLVLCYDLSSVNASGVPSRGALFVHGYPSAGYTTGASGEPKVTDVHLFTAGSSPCTNAYFFFLVSGSCNLGVSATVTFSDATGNNRSVTATIADYNSPPNFTETENLKPSSTTTATATWASDGTGQGKYFNIPAQAGPLAVTLTWTKKAGTFKGVTCSSSNPCTGTWNGYVFQRVHSGADYSSGPIASAVLNEGTASTFTTSTYSYVNNSGTTTHSFWVNLQMQPALGYATGVTSPPVYLRVSGSQNQTIDCSPTYSNLRDELDFGCDPQYTLNTPPYSCPAYSVLWSTPQPWNCVKTQTGNSVGQVTQGLEARMQRLAGTTCPANNWSSFPNFSRDDPRLVPVIITPFGTFGSSGNDIIPVTGFTELYITGWAKQGTGGKTQADCTGDDAPPGPGYIVGHFIRYVDTINTGSGGSGCPTSTFGNCVVVLTQ